jgi:hypothetical protein
MKVLQWIRVCKNSFKILKINRGNKFSQTQFSENFVSPLLLMVKLDLSQALLASKANIKPLLLHSAAFMVCYTPNLPHSLTSKPASPP